jgi:hypothetical protein
VAVRPSPRTRRSRDVDRDLASDGMVVVGGEGGWVAWGRRGGRGGCRRQPGSDTTVSGPDGQDMASPEMGEKWSSGGSDLLN